MLALLAATAACSSGSKHTASGPPTSGPGASQSTSSGATPAGSPIKIGTICSCTGPFGPETTPADDVLKAWVKTVNGSGGIEGHPIDLIFLDDESSPGSALTDAQTLISDHVPVIIDNSAIDVAWATAAAAAKIPVIGGITGNSFFGTNPDFYATAETIASQNYAQVALAKEAGATNFGILYCAESPVCAQEVPAMRTFGQQLGMPLTYHASVSITAPNYTAQCVAAQQDKVKAMIFADAETAFVRAGTDCDRQGYDPIWVAPAAAYTPAVSATPGVKKNLWVQFGDLPYFENAPEVQAMNSALDKYYPGVRQGRGGLVWVQGAVQTWTAGLLVRDAIKASGLTSSGTLTASQMTRALDSIKNDTLDGWAPPLTFTAGQPHPVNCWFTVHFVNGRSTLMNNGRAECHNV